MLGCVSVQIADLLLGRGWRLDQRLLGLALLKSQLHGPRCIMMLVMLEWRWTMVLWQVVVMVWRRWAVVIVMAVCVVFWWRWPMGLPRFIQVFWRWWAAPLRVPRPVVSLIRSTFIRALTRWRRVRLVDVTRRQWRRRAMFTMRPVFVIIALMIRWWWGSMLVMWWRRTTLSAIARLASMGWWGWQTMFVSRRWSTMFAVFVVMRWNIAMSVVVSIVVRWWRWTMFMLRGWHVSMPWRWPTMCPTLSIMRSAFCVILFHIWWPLPGRSFPIVRWRSARPSPRSRKDKCMLRLEGKPLHTLDKVRIRSAMV